jgi:Leucine-rich repeat (LRR) protein
LSNEELTYIGATCPNLVNLAITFPEIQEAVDNQYIDAFVKKQLEKLAVSTH